MKITQKFRLAIQLFVISISILSLSMQCEKQYPPGTPEIDKLPPITQTGANTFGCLVDGVAFTPKGGFYSSGLQLYYQFVDGAYHFNIGADRKEGTGIKDIEIRSHGIELEEKKYEMAEFGSMGFFGAEYTVFAGNGEILTYQTTSIIKGEITFTRFDKFNQIASGTFWFDAINDDGKIVQVRAGRFDANFVL
jgi:hypothetical protein